MNTTEKLMSTADRAFELLEQKSPHQLAVELAELQQKQSVTLTALNKMQDQRDQLVVQLKDATQQCGVMVGLLREGLDAGDPDYYYGSDLMRRIEGALAGKLPATIVFDKTKLPTDLNLSTLRPGQILVIKKPGAEYMRGAADFKQELIKATKVFAHPHIDGVFAVFEGRHERASQQQEGGE